MAESGTGTPSRVLLLLTLLGLAGCALVAVLHPLEHYDPARSLEQVGRNVQVNLEITTSHGGDGWARGDALPLDADDHPHPQRVQWVWFRPPESYPQPGDRVQGRAQLTQDGNGMSLLLDGARAAQVTPGPLPVPVHWQTLVLHPQPLEGRLLLVNGQIDGDRLRATDDSASCPLDQPPDGPSDGTRWLVRLQPHPQQPGWSCRLEGPA